MSDAGYHPSVFQLSHRLRGDDVTGGKYEAGSPHAGNSFAHGRGKAFSVAVVAGCAALLCAIALHSSWSMLVYALAGMTPAAYLLYFCRQHLGSRRIERRRAQHMAELHLRSIEALALAVDATDPAAHLHLTQARAYAEAIGRAMGLSDAKIEALRTAALLHDIGKLPVPEHIVNKPARLSDEEFEKMKIHPVAGAEILERSDSSYPVATILRAPHTWWDGGGFPDGRNGEQIPSGASIANTAKDHDAIDSAGTDYLTGLPNARSLSLELESEIDRCQSEQARFGIVLCSLDGVRQVNHHFGHMAGDQVLKVLARKLRIACRENDYVARMGGDQFAILAPGLKASDVPTVRDRICAAAAVSAEEACGAIDISLSMGIAFYPEDSHNAAQLLMEADKRLSRMKKAHPFPRIVHDSTLRRRPDAQSLPSPQKADDAAQDGHRSDAPDLGRDRRKPRKSVA